MEETAFVMTEDTARRVLGKIGEEVPKVGYDRGRGSVYPRFLWVKTSSGAAGVATQYTTDGDTWADLTGAADLVVLGGSLEANRRYLAARSGDHAAGVAVFVVLGDADEIVVSGTPTGYGGLVNTSTGGQVLGHGPKTVRGRLTVQEDYAVPARVVLKTDSGFGSDLFMYAHDGSLRAYVRATDPSPNRTGITSYSLMSLGGPFEINQFNYGYTTTVWAASDRFAVARPNSDPLNPVRYGIDGAILDSTGHVQGSFIGGILVQVGDGGTGHLPPLP